MIKLKHSNMNWTQFFRDAALGTTAYMSMKAAKGIESLNDAFGAFQKRTEAQLESIRSDIKHGFATLSLELAVHSEIFKNILNVLQNKRKTEAEELKQFGLTALRNGWSDDAIQDFEKSLELNRYDYQVYYFLSKCYYLKDDLDRQNKFLELSYHYSAEDPSFRLYIVLDIVVSLVEQEKYDEAKRVIEFAEETINSDADLTPLLLAKIYIAVFNHEVNNSTLEAISQALESYQGDDPSKLMTIIIALSQQCDNETQLRIENLFNLKKLKITQTYGKKVLTFLSNITLFLSYIQKKTNWFNPNLNGAPSSVLHRFIPAYDSINIIQKKIQFILSENNSLSIKLFDKLLFLMPLLSSLENQIIEDIKWATSYNNSPLNHRPYEQISAPILNFNVGKNDKILLQLKLSDGTLLTLTIFKIILIETNKKTHQYDLYEDFYNLSFPELFRHPDFFTHIGFYLRDSITDKVITVNNSNECSDNYNINDSRANFFDLFKQRAANLLQGYVQMSIFNLHLELLDAYLDMLNSGDNNMVSATSQSVSGDVEDVEFLD